MKIAEPYKRYPVREPYDAIVIGSGIGGLGAAALLANQGGWRVLVLERHYTAGGYTHVFRRPGYEWDVGVHYIGDVQPGTVLRAVFDEVTGGRLGWADMGEVYDRVVIGDDQRFLRPATPIRGLYLTGQDIVSCGVAGALFGGVLSASAILRRNLLKAILRSAGRRNRPARAPAVGAAA